MVMARALGRLAAQHRLVLWSVQVDDVAAMVLRESGAAVCDCTVAVHEDIQQELEGGCRLPLAPAKRTVVATDSAVAEAIAARLGPGAEVGTWSSGMGSTLPCGRGRRRGRTAGEEARLGSRALAE